MSHCPGLHSVTLTHTQSVTLTNTHSVTLTHTQSVTLTHTHSVTLTHKAFLESQNVAIFRRKVVADVISLDDVILEEGGPLIQSDLCPLGQTQREGDHVEAGAERGIMKLECQGTAIRKQGRGVNSGRAQASPLTEATLLLF